MISMPSLLGVPSSVALAISLSAARAGAAATATGGGSPAPLTPVNTLLPAITGIAQEGQILSVSIGSWSNDPILYSYQWRRGGVALAGSINASRTLTLADVGAVMSCAVTATNAAGSTLAVSANTVAVIAASVPVPINTVAPAVMGTGTVGQVLTTDNGTWSNSPTGYSYAWRRDGVDIAGAISQTYTLVAADGGKAVTCRVFAANAGGTAGATSNSIAIAVTPSPSSPGVGNYLLPSNVNGGEAGKGFTCTGLARDPLDGSWWVGNDGRKNGGSTPDGSIVHISPDFSTVLGEYKAAAFGLGAGFSAQGVCMMNDLIVAVFKKPGTGSSGLDYFITIDRTGATVRNVVSPSSTADWNGIAYDSLRNALIVSNVGGIAWRDPVTIAAYSPTKSISVSNVDQVFYVASDDTLLTTGGANGSDGTVVKYRASDLVEIARTTATGSKAIEGIVEYDGKWAIANDAWFHNGGAGLDEVRIIAKLL